MPETRQPASVRVLASRNLWKKKWWREEIASEPALQAATEQRSPPMPSPQPTVGWTMVP